MRINNDFVIPAGCAFIPIASGHVALVDVEDAEYLLSMNWYLGNNGYVTTRKDGRLQMMHRLINQTPKGMETDHINNIRLDNRKCNLRTCTRTQNAQHNSKSSTIGLTRYKGVNRVRKLMKWVYRASLTVNQKNIYLGQFESAEHAAEAYDNAARAYFGEFAKTNF